MPKTFISIGFLDQFSTQYTADYGDTVDTTGRIQLPESIDQMTQGNAETLVNAAGGTLLKLGGQVIEDVSSACPESSAGFRTRRLRFILSDGSSFTVPIHARASLVTAATAIRDLVTTVNGNITVPCIQLIGEEWSNLNDVLGVNFDSTATSPQAGSSKYYSGFIDYQTDTNVTTPHPVKVMANPGDAPPPIFSTIWDACAGAFLERNVRCPVGTRKRPREHRRYIVNYLAQDDNAQLPESRELPVATQVSSAIRACGVSLAGEASVFCIGYKGESYRLFHKLLP